mmetsp:Transcript_16719/g.52668  ORF Transcript_16719/g.52668 Transcript_16719/m.52668 type:complete len:211 (+) Transcript_16719:2443-3075(+)
MDAHPHPQAAEERLAPLHHPPLGVELHEVNIGRVHRRYRVEGLLLGETEGRGARGDLLLTGARRLLRIQVVVVVVEPPVVDHRTSDGGPDKGLYAHGKPVVHPLAEARREEVRLSPRGLVANLLGATVHELFAPRLQHEHGLHVAAPRHRVHSALEEHLERIPLGRDHVPLELPDGAVHQPVMGVQVVRHGLGVALPERGRPLDVRDDDG